MELSSQLFPILKVQIYRTIIQIICVEGILLKDSTKLFVTHIRNELLCYGFCQNVDLLTKLCCENISINIIRGTQREAAQSHLSYSRSSRSSDYTLTETHRCQLRHDSVFYDSMSKKKSVFFVEIYLVLICNINLIYKKINSRISDETQ